MLEPSHISTNFVNSKIGPEYRIRSNNNICEYALHNSSYVTSPCITFAEIFALYLPEFVVVIVIVDFVDVVVVIQEVFFII